MRPIATCVTRSVARIQGTAVSCESQAIRFGGGKQLWVQTEPLRYTETVQIGATWPVRLNEMPGD